MSGSEEPGGTAREGGVELVAARRAVPMAVRAAEAAAVAATALPVDRPATVCGTGRPVPSGARAAVIATAALVLVPALAVDGQGARLGRGGGPYHRTLPLVSPGSPVVAVVRDD